MMAITMAVLLLTMSYPPCFRCYLNPETHFIWAFIAPVLVIMFINVAFIIMAATVMWRHKKRLTGKMEAKKIKNWLKALLSLTVIMGLTWIFGVLIVEVQALVPLAYIYTILVAFQGVIIFILFVVLDSKVRGDCTKAWRSTVKQPDLLSRNFRSSSKSTSVSLRLQLHRNLRYSIIIITELIALQGIK